MKRAGSAGLPCDKACEGDNPVAHTVMG
jgi:hypothetical protein